MNILIPLAPSNNNHIDLRYALRSACSIYTPERVIIVGELPDWVKGVEYYKHPNARYARGKELNILAKCIEGLRHCSEALILHDDHYITEPVQLWRDGTILEKYNQAGNVYKRTVANTIKLLGPDHSWFDVHAPFFASYTRMKALLQFDWSKGYGYGLKTLYFAGQTGVQMQDRKYEEWGGSAPYFSTGMRFTEWHELDKLWPDPSPYETNMCVHGSESKECGVCK